MLRQCLLKLSVPTSGEGFVDLTADLNREISASGLDTGVAVLACLHTSCSLTINENADPRVLADLATYLRALVPEEGVKPISGQGGLRAYSHADEGPDDMPSHIRMALTRTSEVVPVMDGRMTLGTWQGIFLFEHRRAPHQREIAVNVMGE